MNHTEELIHVSKRDAFGDRSIAILGDSIVHGAGSGDIPKNSYIGIFKQAVNAYTGVRNYGFTSVEGTLWGRTVSHEMHPFPRSSCGFRERGAPGEGWEEYRSAELLGTKGLSHSAPGAALEFTPRETFRYFCIYFQAGEGYGRFTVGTGGGKILTDVHGQTEVDCSSYAFILPQIAGDGGNRTAFYRFSDLEDNTIRLTVQGGGEVIFTGIGYVNDPDGVIVSNYGNGGLQLAGCGKRANGDVTGLDPRYLDLAATSGTLIFSLGYNDSHFPSCFELFVRKIDHLISACRKNGTKVIVSDTCWYLPRFTEPVMDENVIASVMGQLRRLARETDGIYIDYQAICGKALEDTISDGAHPNAEGHRLIARALLDAVGLSREEK